MPTSWRPGPDWRAKALIQQLISAAPASHRVNYWFQTHVTKRLPVSEEELKATAVEAHRHVRAYEAHANGPMADAAFFEFGAGWDMGNPIALFLLGVRHQLVVDLRPLARPELIDDLLRRLPEAGGFNHQSVLALEDVADAARKEADAVDKLRHFGIDYQAPSDARATGLRPSSIDCVTSTAVLEHIPARDIPKIFRELHRVLRDGGVMSCEIDYHDHYCTFDKSITPYNFLRYSDPLWRIFNPALNYQNRLRHSEYLGLARDAGFELLEEELSDVGPSQLAELASVPLAEQFRHFEASDLAITQSHLVLRKP